MAKINDAIKIIDKMNHNDPEIQEMVAVASINAEVAQLTALPAVMRYS